MCPLETDQRKIINDPVYGFVRIGESSAQKLIDHSIFQRLRRIVQMGAAFVAYPGATHTRFHHSIGAYHLMGIALKELERKKPNLISEAEKQAALYATLLHDIGHSPFSHTLERQFVDFSHEELSLLLMNKLNEELDGALSLAICIYKGEYKKKFLCQLVHGQLDVDRLDYLARDSFYTGVVEGKVGYDRILKMIDTENEELVVEEKGCHSIENFLMARHFMYQQVYLHKTSVCAEQILAKVVLRARELAQSGLSKTLFLPSMYYFLMRDKNAPFNPDDLAAFLELDDADIWQLLKVGRHHEDKIFAHLSKAIIERKLFKVMTIENEEDEARKRQIEETIQHKMSISHKSELLYFAFTHQTTQTNFENDTKNTIMIKDKRGKIRPIAEYSSFWGKSPRMVPKQYFCYLAEG